MRVPCATTRNDDASSIPPISAENYRGHRPESDNWPAKRRRPRSRSICGRLRSNMSGSPHGSTTARRLTLEA